MKLMNHPSLYLMGSLTAKIFKDFPVPQQKHLAMFSQAVLLAEHCHHSRIAAAVLGDADVESYERRLRRAVSNERLDPIKFTDCWAPYVFNALPEGMVVLQVDETTAGKRFRQMMVSAAFERRAIHLAWRTYKEQDAAAYPPEGQVKMIGGMLRQLKAVMPPQRQVVVLADRGIGYSTAMCKEVINLGWTFLFRAVKDITIETAQGVVRPKDIVKPCQTWRASGRIFASGEGVEGHIIVRWEKGKRWPWILITNDPNLTSDCYRKRFWQEQSFRDLKSSGFDLKKTKMRCAIALSRFMIFLVLAHGAALFLGCIAVSQGTARALIRPKSSKGKPRAAKSLFQEGLRYLRRKKKARYRLPAIRFIPDSRW